MVSISPYPLFDKRGKEYNLINEKN